MNKIITFFILSFALASCDYNETEPYFNNSEYVPILIKSEEIAGSVKQIAARSIKSPGKILWMGTYILIVEEYEGFHVVDNTLPESPVVLSFVRVPGCIDLSSKNGIVYADNAVDLVAIDMNDVSNIHETSRVSGVFPELLPPGETEIPSIFNKSNRPANTIIVGWKPKNE